VLVAAVVVGVALLAAACGSDGEPTNEGSTHDAYAAVIRWFVDRLPGDAEQHVVFIEARGEGVGIDLDTQAAVVEVSQPFADVRFIDDRSEAIDADGVRDGGVLLGLGPVVVEARTAVIEADEIVDEDTVVSRRFELRLVDDEWVLPGEPAMVAT
jgi:hypothetical protein